MNLLKPNCLLKASLPNTISLGVRASVYELRHANIQLLSCITSHYSEPCAASHFFAFVQVSSDGNTFIYLASLSKMQFEESLKCSPALS